MTQTISIDPVYAQLDPLASPLCRDVWQDKYRWNGESYPEMMVRVADAVFAQDKGPVANQAREDIKHFMQHGVWMPAGRILAGAGTPKRVTMLNCFVNAELEDDMESIAHGLVNIMLTQQQGGGIGTDFSPIRPPRARLFRTGASSSGPGPFMDTWDSACTTIRSAGDRRGAMMGTLICTHPFLPEFLTAKHEKGRWTNFNISVLVTDAFMSAVEEDEEWVLHHAAEPNFSRPPELVAMDFIDDDSVPQFAYSIHRARELWDDLMRSTYDYAEPGVIFIDRVNDLNNLNYVEKISCTNPCGEQPLPPHGCCDLGAVNVSRLVKRPFTEDAEFDWETFKYVAKLGVRFLDNVIDVTNYPLPQQREEEFNKRRIGLGISGLADAMHFLGMRYGSLKSIKFTEQVMHMLAVSAYEASCDLAEEKGAFPLYDEVILDRPFIKQLPEALQKRIKKVKLRNGVLLTIAPTGTTTIAYGNGSSGLEPVFAHVLERKVKQADGSLLPYTEVSYGARLYMHLNPGTDIGDLPVFMNVCADVRIHEHVRIQEVCQKWVDASISKTINLPSSISFEEFKDVYRLAYDSGCKGCTTYRPSEVRGSILTAAGSTFEAEPNRDGSSSEPATVPFGGPRPEVVNSATAKIQWPGLTSSLYLTIGFVDGKPYEVFLNSKDQKAMEWTMGLTLLMSMCLRKSIPLETIAAEFQAISSLEGGFAVNRKTGRTQYWPSLIAYLGHWLECLPATQFEATDFVGNAVGFYGLSATPSSEPLGDAPVAQEDQDQVHPTKMDQCASCNQYAVTSQGGCPVCTNCGASKCS